MMLSGLYVLLPVALACCGCAESFQREYVYTRQEPAVGRKSPTLYAVRIRIDRAAKAVVWVEDVSDNEGDLGRTVRTWEGCTFLDEDNWKCQPVLGFDGEIVDHIEMRDGQLRQQYWTEDRLFRLRRRVGPFAF